MDLLLRLSILLFTILLPFGSQAGALLVDQTNCTEVSPLVSNSLKNTSIVLSHQVILVPGNDLQELREESLEEEEETSSKTVATAFQYPLVNCRPEWNAFVSHPCDPPLFKRYLYFHALKLDC